MLPAMSEEWVRIPEAAAWLGVSVDTVRRRVKRGQLVSRKVYDAGHRYHYEVWLLRKAVYPGKRRVTVIERRATACREAGRWLACLWLLVVGLLALMERREGAR